MKPPEKLPCIVCGKDITLVSHGGHFSWTDGGIWMVETGNYGSTVLDDPHGRKAVFMVICDECLVARKSSMRAVILHEVQSDRWEWLEDIPEDLMGG